MFSSRKKLSLSVLLIVPFVVQITAAVGLTGYLSIRHGQAAVNELAGKLQKEIDGRIQQHLNNYLITPRHLSEINGRAIANGNLRLNEIDRTAQFFHSQVQLNNVGFIGFGGVDGTLISAGRYGASKDIMIDLISQSMYGDRLLHSHQSDAQGHKLQVAQSFPLPFQEEAWYQEAVKSQKPIWTSVYQWKSPPYPLAISASYPVYDAQGKLLGISAIDQQLPHISEFLRAIEISQTGQAFILERNGLLVASSAPEAVTSNVNGNPKRLNASESGNALLQAANQELKRRHGDLNNIQAMGQFQFCHQGQCQFVQVSPWKDEAGLDWLVLILIPEQDFLGQIQKNQGITIGLCAASLLIATGFSILFARWMSRPVARLIQASQAMTNGNLDQTIQGSVIQELDELAFSFSHMAQQLQASFHTLEDQNEALEVRVAERTQELAQALEELKQTQSQLIQTEKMSSLGQMVAGVAHEINNPTNFIHGNLNCVVDYLKDLQQTIGLYHQHYPQPCAEIVAQAEECDLAFILDDLPKLVDSMQEGTRRIREIVLSLRNFSRLDEAEQKAADLNEGLDSTLLILTHKLRRNPEQDPIQVIKQYDQLPPVFCYPSQLNQVFLNILSNAIDALETIEQATITLQTQTIENSIVIQISDNGSGMPEDVQSKLFDPFFTTKDVGKGTGLGMSISYQIITQKHDGQISCRSTPGEGTTFTLQIPLKGVDELNLSGDDYLHKGP